MAGPVDCQRRAGPTRLVGPGGLRRGRPGRTGRGEREEAPTPPQPRSTALFQLATELPAALLARMLGIHIAVAVAWQRASSGDWTGYAADYSRRQRPTAEPIKPKARIRD